MNEKTHVLRNGILGLAFIVLVMAVIPDLGAHHVARTTVPQESNSLDSLDQGHGELRTWTVFLHRGYNADFGCWILRLNGGEHGYDADKPTSDFCAKDKADYNNHPDGSQYQTSESWLDNLTNAPGPSNGA